MVIVDKTRPPNTAWARNVPASLHAESVAILNQLGLLVPVWIKSTFLAAGGREQKKWIKVSASAMRKHRKTWPGKRVGPLTNKQRAYVKSATPLKDTKRLMKSFEVTQSKMIFPSAEITVSTRVKYARKHDLGIEGVKKRPYMHLTPSDQMKIENLFIARLGALFR